MNITYINSSVSHSVDFFKKNLFASLNNQQESVMSIALPIFLRLAAIYVIYQSFYLICDLSSLIGKHFRHFKDDELNNVSTSTFDLTDRIQINQMLANDASITYRNASSMEEARIILMGENHSIPRHREQEVLITNHFASEGDILLVEGVEYKEDLLDSATFISTYNFRATGILKKVQVTGWEDGLEVITNSPDKDLFCKEAEIFFKDFIPKANVFFEQAAAIETSSLDLEEKEDRIKKLEEPLLIKGNEFFNRLKDLRKESDQAKEKRDQFLISSIIKASNKYPLKKIFVISGSSHIFADGFNILDHLPADLKCAAVIFKKDDVGSRVD